LLSGEHDLQATLTTCSLPNGSIVWRISRLQVNMSTRVKTASIAEEYGIRKTRLSNRNKRPFSGERVRLN